MRRVPSLAVVMQVLAGGVVGACIGVLIFSLVGRSPKVPKAELLFAEMLNDAIAFLGKPAIPIRQVKLGGTLDSKSTWEHEFPMAELIDAKKGVFAIYLIRQPGEYFFYGQFAHEVARLLNARLWDCYAEGLNTLFAERFLKKQGMDWTGWERHFSEGGDPLYAATYFMMRDITAITGEKPLQTLLRFARWTDTTGGRMHIDINAWLATLPENQRGRVRDVIYRRVDAIKRAIVIEANPIMCLLPNVEANQRKGGDQML